MKTEASGASKLLEENSRSYSLILPALRHKTEFSSKVF